MDKFQSFKNPWQRSRK